MEKGILSKELKIRQYKYNDKEIVDALSDDQIIDSYITCSCCGEKQVNETELNQAIDLAKNAEHFFYICDTFGSLHKHEN